MGIGVNEEILNLEWHFYSRLSAATGNLGHVGDLYNALRVIEELKDAYARVQAFADMNRDNNPPHDPLVELSTPKKAEEA